MNGFVVMLWPFVWMLKIAAIAAAVLCIPAGFRLLHREVAEFRYRLWPVAPALERRIVRAYNQALDGGWPPGESVTFELVSSSVGTSPAEVRAVIARHWRRR